MPILSLHKQLIEKIMTNYCSTKIPKEFQNQIRLSYKIRGNNITIIESRPYFQDNSIWTDMKIAQIRFRNEDKSYTLYCLDRNERYHLYELINSSKDLNELLKEIDDDPTGIFWG